MYHVRSQIGLAQLLEGLMQEYIVPVARVLFPQWGGGSLDSLHAFTIQYSANEDRDLGRHLDEADVTVNICLVRCHLHELVYITLSLMKLVSFTLGVRKTFKGVSNNECVVADEGRYHAKNFHASY